MKKRYILCISTFNFKEKAPVFSKELEKEWSENWVQKENFFNLCLRREVEEFNLPVDSPCFFFIKKPEQPDTEFNARGQHCLTFKVKGYSIEINADISEAIIYVDLHFHSCSMSENAADVINFLMTEWKPLS